MTTTVAVLIADARGTLIDAAAVTFSDTTLVSYLNEAVEATCFAKPDAYTVQASFSLTPGILQELPEGAVALLDIISTGSGAMVTQVDKALLEAADPRWPSQDAVQTIEHYTADPRNPRRWLNYPPAAAGATVIALYGATPARVAISGSVPLPDAYVPCLIDFVLARAYAMNSKKQDMTKSAYHRQQWGAALGLKSQAQITNSPRIAAGTPT